MTVDELIEALSEYPGDYPVMLGYTRISDVYCEEDFYFADSPNPQRAIGPAVIIE